MKGVLHQPSTIWQPPDVLGQQNPVSETGPTGDNCHLLGDKDGINIIIMVVTILFL